MKPTIESYYFSHKGKRNTNEDFIISDPNNGIFIITDGIGGYEYGEVASKLVASSCHNFLLKNKIASQAKADELLAFIHKEIELHVEKNPTHIGMGTTLACVQINEDFYSLIHIGDSRIYHIDLKSSEYWRTRDDTYVQELIEQDIITNDQAELHTLKNRITKSIIADNKSKDFQISFKLRKKQKGNCLLFLCTDGVLESYSEKSLLHHLRDKKSKRDLMAEIEIVTISRSTDNTSAVLVELIS